MWLQQVRAWWPRPELTEVGNQSCPPGRDAHTRDGPGGTLPAGETRLLLCKQNLLLDFGRNKKAMYESFPRLHAEVRLAVYVQQSFETRSSTLPAVGYFLCLLVSSTAKTRLSLVDVLQAGGKRPI